MRIFETLEVLYGYVCSYLLYNMPRVTQNTYFLF